MRIMISLIMAFSLLMACGDKDSEDSAVEDETEESTEETEDTSEETEEESEEAEQTSYQIN